MHANFPRFCLSSGKLVAADRPAVHTEPRMSDLEAIEELVGYMTRTSRWSSQEARHVVEVSASEPELDSILLNIPLRLRAYRVELARGTDIDQSRNLARPLTVE